MRLPLRAARSRLVALLGDVRLRALALTAAIAVSLWSLDRVPDAAWLPAVVGLVPWTVGKYVLCPLRWHALSASRRPRRWHLRTYAEGELLGLVSPGHAGADLWRVHRLESAGLPRCAAVAEVALDRLVGALGLTLFVVLAGATLPPAVLAAAVTVAAVVLVSALALRRWRPDLLAHRPMPPRRVIARGVLLSLAYQATIIGLLLGTLGAVGHEVDPVRLLAVFGASQVAGIIPGVHGASPRDGALVVGIASLGVPWSAAVGAVALSALLAWVPALLLGGGSLLGRRLQGLRPLRAA